MSDIVNKGGRPRLYDSPEAMAEKIDAYFDMCEEKGKRPTVAGLCYFLGFEDRGALQEYEKYEEFSRTAKRARLRIETDRTESLIEKDRFTPGLIFDLKNNFGWKDKTEQEVSGPNGGPVDIRTVQIVPLTPTE